MPGKRKARPPEGGEEGLVELHRASFVEWAPAPVAALAGSADGSLAAALREDGDIELYDTATLTCIQRLPGAAAACATCLALVEEEEDAAHRSVRPRLFSGGLDGAVAEHSLESLSVAAAADAYGGAVWALAAEPAPGPLVPGAPRRLAAACDDGAVRLLRVEHGVPGATYYRALPRVEGRALAVAWHPSGHALASAGTDNCVHLWSAATGAELLRITAGDGRGGDAAADACVWDVLVLPDGTVVSADSGGSVAFWDGQFGTLLARFRQHRADVLRLAATPDGNTVFAAGVDSQVAVFRRLAAGGAGGGAAGSEGGADDAGGGAPPQPWAFLAAKRPHSHDVRALCVVTGRHAPAPLLLSGGNDAQVLAHPAARFLNEHPVHVDACPQRPLLQAARLQGGGAAPAGAAPWLLAVQRDTCDIWQLGTAIPGARGTEEGTPVNTAMQPLHMARLANKGGRFIAAAALSPDGAYLAFSDVEGIKCLRLEERPGSDAVPVPHLGLAPLPLPRGLPPARLLAFRPGGGPPQLVACAMDGTVRLVDLDAASAAAAAGGDAGAASADASAGVVVLRGVHDLKYKPHAKRDRQRSAARWALPPVELMAASPDGRWLALVARQRIHLVSLASHKLVGQLPPVVPDGQFPISALAFLPDGHTLLAATSAHVGGADAHQLAAFDVEKLAPTEWSRQLGGGEVESEAAAGGTAAAAAAQPGLPPRVRGLSGGVARVAARPGAPAAALLQTPAALCALDLARPLERAGEGGDRRQRRRPHKPVLVNSPAGDNCRVLYGDKVLLHAEYLGPSALLLVERSWEEAWAGVAPPLYRHRYGS